MAKIYLNSFFSGIGGFERGFQSAGVEAAFFCEKSSFCRSIIKRHWPTAPVSPDIEFLDAKKLPEAQIWTAGFPCQDVSVARGWLGREGLKGKRTGLFYSFLELVEARLPRVVVLENVTGLLNSHSGRDFATILKSLTSLGYGVAWRVLNARYFGSPQSRPRVFICAWYQNVDLAVTSLFERGAWLPKGKERAGFLTPCEHHNSGAIVPEVAYCLAATSGRHTGTDWSRSYVSYEREVRRLTPVECERLQGFPPDWTLPGAELKQSVDDIDTLRYHALGNAVCVPVVEWIAKRIVNNLDKICKTKCVHPPVKLAQSIHPSLVKEPTIQMLENLNEEFKWHSGGCANREVVAHGISSPAPLQPLSRKLIEIIDERPLDRRYYLSPNAAEGILRRVNSQGRTLFGPLQSALMHLADVQLEGSEKGQIEFPQFTSCQTSSLFD